MKKKIGIIGGMGPEALVDMYMGICRYYQNNFGAKYDKDFPPMIMYSVPIPDVVESLENEKETLKALIKAAKVLQEDGCDFIVIACNSVQFLLQSMRKTIKIPIIGIAEIVAKYLQDKKFRKVGILATKITIKKKTYTDELKKIGIGLIKPDRSSQNTITKVIMAQLSGKVTKKEAKKLVSITRDLKKKGAEAILIACTDLPLITKQSDVDVALINCTEIYANEAARISTS